MPYTRHLSAAAMMLIQRMMPPPRFITPRRRCHGERLRGRYVAAYYVDAPAPCRWLLATPLMMPLCRYAMLIHVMMPCLCALRAADAD